MNLRPQRRTAQRLLTSLAALSLVTLGNAMFAGPASAADGVDLHPVFSDVKFGAGSTVVIEPLKLKNAGTAKATGVVLTLELVSESGPAPLRFVAGSDCTDVSATRVRCPMPDVPAGATIDVQYGGVYIKSLETNPVPGSPNPTSMPAHVKVGLSAAEPELNPADNTVDSPKILRTVKVGARDWSIATQPVSGKVGDVVDVPITVDYKGPGGIGQGETVTHFVLPDGAEFVEQLQGCADAPSGVERVCTSTGFLEQPYDRPYTYRLRIKIVKAIVADGKVHIEGMGGDLKPADNTAKIVINVDGVVRPTASIPTGTSATASHSAAPAPGLPVTGDKTTIVAATGAAVLIVGAVLLVLGRRRRVRLELPRD
ncbi:LPXTG cell wall anchor domain-containing protein [Dactylosporangium sp. NPDC000521]|uniref:LPXTG cell wall anchor domain-containing protein n=1 Tax=Dactylosporangium sp. NPDC000521 TaxID=3363975 RepID=UPI0036C61A02